MSRPHAKASTVLHSFYYAFRGLQTGYAEERNFRVQCGYAVLVAALLLWCRPPLLGSLLALATVTLLLSAELANSALERVVDLVSPQANARAGEAKDLSAAAVMLLSFLSACTVLLVLQQSLEREALTAVGGLFLWILIRRQDEGGRV